MPATQSDLDIELEHLRLDVGNLNVLRKMTRAQERRVMGDVFVWWQRAREVDGRADVGTLDSYYLDLLRQHEPAYAAQVRVVDSTRAHPIPPLVATAALSEAQTSQLRGALIDTATEPALALLMQRLMLKGFSVVESQDYDHLADMARAQTEPFDRL